MRELCVDGGRRKRGAIVIRGFATIRLAKTRVQPCLDYPTDIPRPRTRGECKGEPRPCPWVSCRHHLYLEALGPRDRGNPGIKLNFARLEPWELGESCALDVADRGGATLEQVGHALNLTRERVRQYEESICRKLHRKVALRVLREVPSP